MRNLCIEFRNLPPRPRRLTPAETSAVFGGCEQNDSACEEDKDCCSGHCKKDWVNWANRPYPYMCWPSP
jgi:hypothetical protein